MVEGTTLLLAMRIESHRSSIAAGGGERRTDRVPVIATGSVGTMSSARRWMFASAVLMAATSIGVGCSSGGSSGAVPSDPVLAQGQQIYQQNCASCHGKAGGGGLGPKLAGLVAKKYPNIADQEAVIINGRSSMPKFGVRLSAEEITAVARYEREFLGTK